MKQIRSKGLIILQAKRLLTYPEIIHGISTRQGGTSQGPYRGLNLSDMVGDNARRVRENRAIICQALGIPLGTFTSGKQVHGSRIRIVEEPSREPLPSTDAMLTNKPGITLVAFSADCPLIIVYDPVKKVIGTIHASWRGTAQQIITKTISQLKKAFGSRPADIRAVVSPCIGPCCYEVKKDFLDVVTKCLPYAHTCVTKRTYFNLRQLVRQQLLLSGLRPQHLEISNLCTKCHPELYYSYRRDGAPTGRFGALVYLR